MIKNCLLAMMFVSSLCVYAMQTLYTMGSKTTDFLTYPGSAVMYLGQCLHMNDFCNRVCPVSWCNVSERYQQAVLGGAALTVTGYALTKVAGHYYTVSLSKHRESELLGNGIKSEYITPKFKQLLDDIRYDTKSLADLEEQRIALLQEVMPDIQVKGKPEAEIHKRLMDRLCSRYIDLMFAISDVNQALLELKNRKNNKPDEQQDLGIKGYVL